MDRETAINRAKMEVIGNFEVSQVWGFVDATDEANQLIRAADGATSPVPEDEPPIESLGVVYVTLGWDHVAGDGDFRVTVRIEDGFPTVVDFVAEG